MDIQNSVQEITQASSKDNPENASNFEETAGRNNLYSELMELELCPLVPNTEVFECSVCLEACEVGAGVVLRACAHAFCHMCLADSVRLSDGPVVGCPATGCAGTLEEREIRYLTSAKDYEIWLERCLTSAEHQSKNAFHCRSPDCKGWALCEPDTQQFLCPVCDRISCISCKTIHEGLSCDQHLIKSHSDDGSHGLLENLMAGESGMKCPECQVLITKVSGCDAIVCSVCKTEICWVTRGRRWGPNGKGDTSGGCGCSRQRKCHPKCGNCH